MATSWYAVSQVVFEQHKLVEMAWNSVTDAATYLVQLHREHFVDPDQALPRAMLSAHELPAARKIGTLDDNDVFDWVVAPESLGDDEVVVRGEESDAWTQAFSKEDFLSLIDKRQWTRFGDHISR